LRQVSSFLKANWQIRKVLIEGHTDSRGDKEMNVDLSERRARRVMAFLISQGVSRRILKAKGYGPTSAIASNRTGAGRAKNRRVAFKVLQVFVPKQTTSGKGGQP
jgi:outer membrane protein OmpA-like peptidoglycan-associated protein